MDKRKIMNYVFISIELLLYILIFTTKSNMVSIYSYLSIVCAFAYSLTFLEYKQNKSANLLRLGLLFTVIADFFLVLLGGYKEAAMIAFSMTQISYALLLLEFTKYIKIELVVRAIGSLLTLVITLVVLKENIDFLALISMFYYFNLILNAIYSFIHSPSNLFTIGLVLFIMCDTIIGLQNMINYLPIGEESLLYKIIFVPFNLAWVFYLPSQVLISLTSNSLTMERINKLDCQKINNESEEIKKVI